MIGKVIDIEIIKDDEYSKVVFTLENDECWILKHNIQYNEQAFIKEISPTFNSLIGKEIVKVTESNRVISSTDNLEILNDTWIFKTSDGISEFITFEGTYDFEYGLSTSLEKIT